MANQIKLYKELLQIELKDGTILTSEKTVDDLEKYLNSVKDFCKIDGVIFNKYEFKKAMTKNCSIIDNYIHNQPTRIKEILKTREKEKKSRIGKGFESIGEIERFLKTKGYI